MSNMKQAGMYLMILAYLCNIIAIFIVEQKFVNEVVPLAILNIVAMTWYASTIGKK